MKKRLLAFAMVLAICLSMAGTAFAESELNQEITPKSIVLFSSGLTRVSGNTYTAWAIAMPAISEYVIVGLDLYRIVNGSEVYVTSASASGTGTNIRAENNVSLSAGTYKLYAWYYGQTQSDSTVKTYSIS